MFANSSRSFSLAIRVLLGLSFTGCGPWQVDPAMFQPVESSAEARKRDSDRDINFGHPSSLPLPSTLDVNAFESELFGFLKDRQYVELGWKATRPFAIPDPI